MANEVVVCCVKWGTKYPPLYVNRLHRMVERHLSRPHDFVCLTDDPSGLGEGIGTIPLPDPFTGFWNKLSLFRPDIFTPGRTILYLDVDLVILGPLDFLLDDPGGFHIVRGFSANPGCNSSVMRFEAGKYAHVYERFAERAEAILASGHFTGDQGWIWEQVPDIRFFPTQKIVSYKKGMRSHVFPLARKLGLERWIRAPDFMTVDPPPDASIVVFHGKPDPEDVMDAPYGPWKRAPFVKEHWR